MNERKFTKSLQLQKRMHAAIPGGSHTYSKGDDQYPEFCPPIISKGKGCRVWDVDGNEYIEYGMGLRAVGLGHAYPKIIDAAFRQMHFGSNFNRPAAIELKAAETFLQTVPGAEMVKFAKNGSDATSAAVKLARAHTGREMVALCGDHPFFSVDDWFIGTTAINRGIPQSQLELSVTFHYNDIESVKTLFSRYPGQIACFIMEPEKYEPLDLEFMSELQQLCRAEGALLIFDEMITGFRWHLGGAQTLYNVVPDLSTFGKAMGNGFSIAALAGRREFMELGGLHHQQERVFLLSTTHGAETHGLAAFMAVVEEYEQKDVIAYFRYQGERLRRGMQRIIDAHQLGGYIGIHGHPSSLVFSTRDQDHEPSQPFRTLFMQECLQRGLLAPSLILSYSHRNEDVNQTLEIIEEAAVVYRKALQEGVEKYLRGRPVQPVYRKLNHQPESIQQYG